jgi:hypothetical protein
MSTVLSFILLISLRILTIFTRNRQEPLLLWRTFAADRVTLSEGGAVATQTMNSKWSLATTETELTEGKHYWEVELLSEKVNGAILVGISRPRGSPDIPHPFGLTTIYRAFVDYVLALFSSSHPLPLLSYWRAHLLLRRPSRLSSLVPKPETLPCPQGLFLPSPSSRSFPFLSPPTWEQINNTHEPKEGGLRLRKSW